MQLAWQIHGITKETNDLYLRSKLLNLKCFLESVEAVKFENMLTTNGFALLYTVN